MKFVLMGMVFGMAALVLASVVAQQRSEPHPSSGPRPEIDVKAPTRIETATFALG